MNARTDLVSIGEAARACGRNPETVRRWIWQGKLPAQKLGNQLFIQRHDLEGFLKQNKQAPFRLSERPKYDKAHIEQIMVQSRMLQEKLLAKYGYFDIAAAVRQSREEH